MEDSPTTNANSRDGSSSPPPSNPSSPKSPSSPPPPPSNPSPPKSPSSPPPPPQPFSLVEPSELKSKKQKRRVFHAFRSVFRSLPILTPSCKFPVNPVGFQSDSHVANSGIRVTGTLFGYRKGKVSLSVQETPNCLPSLVLELAIQTNVLQKELSAGMVRIALECDKLAGKDKYKVFDEPLWTMYCNGKMTGRGVRREATAEDLNVMELLRRFRSGPGFCRGIPKRKAWMGSWRILERFSIESSAQRIPRPFTCWAPTEIMVRSLVFLW